MILRRTAGFDPQERALLGYMADTLEPGEKYLGEESFFDYEGARIF